MPAASPLEIFSKSNALSLKRRTKEIDHMPVQGTRALLVGLEPPLAVALSQHLSARGLEVHHAETLKNINQPFDIAFCEAHQPGLLALLSAIAFPVVVVSRIPDVNEWLDAMDAGAADYCAVPFEHEQLDWILHSTLDSALAQPHLAAVAAA